MAGTITYSASQTIVFSGAPISYNRNMIVKKIMWCGNTASADDLKVLNYASSELLIECKAGQSNCNLQLDFAPCKTLAGVQISALDAGKLFVYLA